MKTGFEDLVHSVTMRCYCLCGAIYRINSDLTHVFDHVAQFWEMHDGVGHGPTAPQIAANARSRKRVKENLQNTNHGNYKPLRINLEEKPWRLDGNG